MNNFKVLIYVESRYKLSRKRVKKAIGEVLGANSVTSPVEVSVAIVGDRKMRALNKKYRNLDKTTNVLSFPLQNIHPTSHLESPAKLDQPSFAVSGSLSEKEMLNPADVKTFTSRQDQYDTISRLGDIIISYPQVINEAVRDEMLVDDKIEELVKHSMQHLLGIHHQ